MVYILYPMAPPWMAAEKGYLSGGVHQITGRGWADLGLGHLDVKLQGVGNPVAAMPSLHAGMTFLIAAVRHPAAALTAGAGCCWPTRWPCRTALVYYGEHYVVDVLAGALLAVLVLVGCKVWEDARGT